MAYFTTILQRQVDNVWRKKIEDADRQMRLCTSGKEIRDFLNDKTTLNTIGFVIRRHLQRSEKQLLDKISIRTNCKYADLTKNVNIPWEEDFVNELSSELFKMSKANGISISKITWIGYLSDNFTRLYKDTPFKIAFALKMNVETTEELLMACGQDSYCLRKPEHFIYYYSQSRPSYYSWAHAQSLFSRYQTETGINSINPNNSSPGMTNVLRSSLKELLSSNSTDDIADEELLSYMLQHREEFSGLSLSNRDNFLRMTKYLSILYPTYTKIIRKKDPVSKNISEAVKDIPVSYSANGYPQLSELVRALFNTGGWLATSFSKASGSNAGKRTASSIKRRESSENIEYKRAEINEKDDQPFMNAVQFFVDSYAHHLDAIDRVLRCPANPGSVERRDVILFTYFFIRKYPEFLSDEDLFGKELDALTALAYSDNHIDRVMDDVMEQLYDITNCEDYADKSSEKSKILNYLDIFNDVLHSFGMKEMYMPNPWDRFIYMSLFAEDPDFFTEAVLWNTISDDEPESDSAITENLYPETTKLKDTIKRSNLLISSPYSMPIKDSGDKAAREYTVAYIRRQSNNEYITVNKCCFVIGRRDIHTSGPFQDYGISTSDMTISRCHLMIAYADNNYYLADISSRNETLLNNKRMEGTKVDSISDSPLKISVAYKLKNGDCIIMGSEKLEFIIP